MVLEDCTIKETVSSSKEKKKIILWYAKDVSIGWFFLAKSIVFEMSLKPNQTRFGTILKGIFKIIVFIQTCWHFCFSFGFYFILQQQQHQQKQHQQQQQHREKQQQQHLWIMVKILEFYFSLHSWRKRKKWMHENVFIFLCWKNPYGVPTSKILKSKKIEMT